MEAGMTKKATRLPARFVEAGVTVHKWLLQIHEDGTAARLRAELSDLEKVLDEPLGDEVQVWRPHLRLIVEISLAEPEIVETTAGGGGGFVRDVSSRTLRSPEQLANCVLWIEELAQEVRRGRGLRLPRQELKALRRRRSIERPRTVLDWLRVGVHAGNSMAAIAVANWLDRHA